MKRILKQLISRGWKLAALAPSSVAPTNHQPPTAHRCASVKVDALQRRQHASVAASFDLATRPPTDACVIQLKVLQETQSGEHKFKVRGSSPWGLGCGCALALDCLLYGCWPTAHHYTDLCTNLVLHACCFAGPPVSASLRCLTVLWSGDVETLPFALRAHVPRTGAVSGGEEGC